MKPGDTWGQVLVTDRPQSRFQVAPLAIRDTEVSAAFETSETSDN